MLPYDILLLLFILTATALAWSGGAWHARNRFDRRLLEAEHANKHLVQRLTQTALAERRKIDALPYEPIRTRLTAGDQLQQITVNLGQYARVSDIALVLEDIEVAIDVAVKWSAHIYESTFEGDLGEPPRALRIRYENPLELVLVFVGGTIVAGTATKLLAMIRDWSAEKASAPDRATAQARTELAHAEEAEAQARLMSLAVELVAQGRIPPEQLLQLVRRDDVAALERLSDTQISTQVLRRLVDQGPTDRPLEGTPGTNDGQ